MNDDYPCCQLLIPAIFRFGPSRVKLSRCSKIEKAETYKISLNASNNLAALEFPSTLSCRRGTNQEARYLKV